MEKKKWFYDGNFTLNYMYSISSLVLENIVGKEKKCL